jgi:serine/threonine protein kinase
MSSDPHNDPATLTHLTTSSPASIEGSTLNGRYFIEKELKRGGFGIVYLAYDRQLHSRPVVVKVLLDDAYKNEYVVQKFRQEIEALSRIDHPGVVGIVDSGELADGKPFIVMQYVDGFTLRSMLKPEGMDLEHCAQIIKQMGRALTAAHEKGILHRDLKPENVMVQNLGHGEQQVKIIDFGIAKINNSAIAPTTATNIAAGTVAYMAPEQLSSRPVSAATDVYALGEIAYEMVTGRKPFNPETGFELLEMQRAGVRVKPTDLRPSLPQAAEELILQAISFSPANRQTRACNLGDELARALNSNGETGALLPASTVEPAPTQLTNELTPLAANPGLRSDKTMRASYPLSSQARFDSYSQSDPHSDSKGSTSRKLTTLVIGAVVAIALVVVGGWYLLGRKAAAPSGGTPVTINAPERNLSYSLTVQKMRDGLPYQEPFESSGQEIFENGWKFRMNVSSPQTGYLYLLNEGPSASGITTFNVLFPAPSTNSGASYIQPNQEIKTGWMLFDENQGTEKFWIVWSANAVPELEAVKGVVNEEDKGTINEVAQAKAAREFLTAHYSLSKPEVEKDKGNQQTNVRGKGEILVNLIELVHH